jgi:hypothetical protein
MLNSPQLMPQMQRGERLSKRATQKHQRTLQMKKLTMLALSFAGAGQIILAFILSPLPFYPKRLTIRGSLLKGPETVVWKFEEVK